MVQVWASKYTKKDQQLGKIRSIIDHKGDANSGFRREDILLAEVDISEKFDFMEGGLQQVIVKYTGGAGGKEELLIYMVEPNPMS